VKNVDAPFVITGDKIARTGGCPSDEVVIAADDRDAVNPVSSIQGAGDIRADVIPLYDIAGSARFMEVNTVNVARYDVTRGRDRSANLVVAAGDIKAQDWCGKCGSTGRV
jgi:hypothetical protein